MDLFYHASRDIELPRSSRRAASPRAVRSCEACGSELEPGEPSEGGTVGLAFCAACRARLDRSAVQIHFCDGCGESIPLSVVEAGLALTDDGRLSCETCRRRPPAAAPRRTVYLVAAVLLALFIGAALAFLGR